jgi:hypothetical protein
MLSFQSRMTGREIKLSDEMNRSSALAAGTRLTVAIAPALTSGDCG